MNRLKEIWQKLRYFFTSYFIPFLFIVAFFVFAGFAGKSIRELKCTDVTITIENEKEQGFLTRKDILQMLIEKNGRPFKNQPLKEINLFLLEKFLKNNNLVDNVTIYYNLKGNIFVDISFRKPIVRIMSVYQENYYLDDKGQRMNISPNFSSKVPVVSGHTYSTITYPNFDKKIYELSKFIQQDKFLQSLIGQIYIDYNKEAILIPRIGDFTILFGEISQIEQKFKKLRIFYQKIIPAEGWDKYNKVDLRFDKQIVVNKRP